MLEIFDITIECLTGSKTRRAYVYLPTDYDGKKRYPVLYMFDGHNLFSDSEATYGKSWGLKDFLDKNSTPLIVAAVECNHEGNERLSEYSPVDFTFKGKLNIVGKGKTYMDWLVGEFKPYIDENYRTLSDRQHTAIAGSSMGGLMTLFAVAKYNEYFSLGAALSPSLWAYGKNLTPFIKDCKMSNDTILYMDYGSKEFDKAGRAKKYFCTAATELIKKGVNLTSRIVAGGEHCEASWERQIPIFLKVLNLL